MNEGGKVGEGMKYYSVPRWSGEFLDCSMPLVMDTYNRCSYDCLYCFTFYQLTVNRPGYYFYDYRKAPLKWCNPDYIKRLFNGEVDAKAMSVYLRAGLAVQWGGLSDPFDEHERKHGVTLGILQELLTQPLCFSTKAAWWMKDERYRKLVKQAQQWNCKFSIIGTDADVCKVVERGCPSPQARLEALGEYAKLGKGGATLRLRPFIMGLSDKSYLDLIKQARDKGATAMSTEFLCLDARTTPPLKKRYDAMSEALGFDLVHYYKKYSTGSGYLRLNREAKEPYIRKMHDLCQKIGMRFYVSDAHCKEYSCNGSCCGLPESWPYSRGQFTEALIIAKQKGSVSWGDVAAGLTYQEEARCIQCSSTKLKREARIVRRQQTLAEYMRDIWNTPNNASSPYKYFGGVLYPVKVDENGDVVYEYRGEAA